MNDSKDELYSVTNCNGAETVLLNINSSLKDNNSYIIEIIQ